MANKMGTAGAMRSTAKAKGGKAGSMMNIDRLSGCGMTNGNYFMQLTVAPPNKGVVVCEPIDLADFRESDGTASTLTALETNGFGIQWAAPNVDVRVLIVRLPESYSASGDKCELRLLAQMGGSTDTPAIDAAVYRKRAGAALSADLDPTISADLSSAAAYVTIDISGNSCQGGDILVIKLTPEAHGTDAINVYGAELLYSSCLVPYDKTLRT